MPINLHTQVTYSGLEESEKQRADLEQDAHFTRILNKVEVGT